MSSGHYSTLLYSFDTLALPARFLIGRQITDRHLRSDTSDSPFFVFNLRAIQSHEM
jgi:hypothetical protein